MLDIKPDTKCKQDLKYINEWNLHFPDIGKVSFNDQELKEGFDLNTSKLIITDNVLNKKIVFEFHKPIDIIIVPMESVSQSEQGVDLTLQGVSMAFIYELHSSPDIFIVCKIEEY